MKYKIQHRIETLARNAMVDKGDPVGFQNLGIRFSHWEFNHAQGWLHDAWVAEAEIDAENLLQAVNEFRTRLDQVIPRVALISQCYVEYIAQPFLVVKEGSEIGFFWYFETVKGNGLMFMEDEVKALGILLNNPSIPSAFFYYWNDAVNTPGYASKLLLMFSALEALIKNAAGQKDFKKLEDILGRELKEELWNPQKGLRHRLIHGEYFGEGDSSKNYIEIVHRKVIGYFNEKIFGQQLLSEEVVHPQRHFFGNKLHSKSYLRSKGKAKLELKEVVGEFERNGLHQLDNYEHIFDRAVIESY